MEPHIYGVTEVNQLVKGLLDSAPALQGVAVRGELSNYKIYPSGHHYFTLKDQEGALRCVMFRGQASRLRFRPENGMKAVASGRITVFPRDGAYQLYCDSLIPEGVGDLAVAFEQLKDKLYREGLPANWILYQIMCLVDARTFEMYVKNMGQLMMEKITNADMLIFDHCNEQLRAQLRSRNLRMVNRRADIYLENTDGTSEDYVTDDMSPFDLSGGHLDVPDNDYGIWYVDMMDNPQRYDGVTVRYKALMCHSKKFPGIHCPGRFAMVCCNNDMQFLALVCKGEGLEKFKNRQWVEIQATVKKEQCQAYDGEGPVLYVTGVKPCQKPDPENVSF